MFTGVAFCYVCAFSVCRMVLTLSVSIGTRLVEQLNIANKVDTRRCKPVVSGASASVWFR